MTSDVPENREVVDGAGFTFQSGNTADMAERLRFLIANPVIREAAGKAARQRIEEQYQWRQVAVEIEKAYFHVMGWQLPAALAKKPNARAAAAGATVKVARRAG